MSGRRPVVAGNWKMHKTSAEAAALAGRLAEGVPAGGEVDVIVAPPFTALAAVCAELSPSPLAVSAQNVHWEHEGAFTGEVSVEMLTELGVEHVIVGHSERRMLFGETDEVVAKKAAAARAGGLIPIVCVGETEEEREAGRAESVLSAGLEGSLQGVLPGKPADLMIAYEPVWAIGTGKTATPETAQEAARFIRGRLAELFGAGMSEGIRILYGGSVKPGNMEDLMAQPDIDGGLVGGASLDPDSFRAIIDHARG